VAVYQKDQGSVPVRGRELCF